MKSFNTFKSFNF